MRAPGVATGTFAIEVAMDELALELDMDPLELRLLNYAEKDPHSGKPFTEKNLRACYTKGAEQFGWSRRPRGARSMREGRQLIGWGMATETYPGKSLPASCLVRLQPDGRVLAASGAQEIGTGMYTIMTQVAAAVLKMPAGMVTARLGDTTLPEAPIAAGSMSTASMTPTVEAAAQQARKKLIELAVSDHASPAYRAATADVDFRDANIFVKARPSQKEHFAELLNRHGGQPIEATARTKPELSANEAPCHSFGAIFAEVAVDEDVGMPHVRRVVAVYDIGRVINHKTARSQFIGGIVWGISLALDEVAYVDWRYGRVLNSNLADYLVPVNLDIGNIEASALDIPDYRLDSLGARGVGEIGITGTAAAVCNAIYHATGTRIRHLPVTPEKLI